MLTASAAYMAALANTHIAKVKVAAYQRTFTAPSTWAWVSLGDLPVVSGSVTVDGQANVWRTASLEVANDDVRADGSAWADLLTAFDTQLRISYGVQTDYDLDNSSPTIEYVKVATIRVDRITLAQSSDVLTVEASDDGSRVSEYPIYDPWPADGDDDLDRSTIDTIKALITDCYPDTDPPTIADTGVTDAQWSNHAIFQNDRWECINKLAESIGAWVHVDEDGDWLIEPMPYDLGSADWTFATGSGGTVVTWDTGTDRTDMANKVVVRYELPFAGSQSATATDTSPTSPTRWDGPMGRVLRVVDNDTCETPTQAQDAANALLAQMRGKAQTVRLTSVYVPLLIPGDTVSVPMPDGTSESQWVDRVTLPIPAGEMEIATRVVDVTAGA